MDKMDVMDTMATHPVGEAKTYLIIPITPMIFVMPDKFQLPFLGL